MIQVFGKKKLFWLIGSTQKLPISKIKVHFWQSDYTKASVMELLHNLVHLYFY